MDTSFLEQRVFVERIDRNSFRARPLMHNTPALVSAPAIFHAEGHAGCVLQALNLGRPGPAHHRIRWTTNSAHQPMTAPSLFLSQTGPMQLAMLPSQPALRDGTFGPGRSWRPTGHVDIAPPSQPGLSQSISPQLRYLFLRTTSFKKWLAWCLWGKTALALRGAITHRPCPRAHGTRERARGAREPRFRLVNRLVVERVTGGRALEGCRAKLRAKIRPGYKISGHTIQRAWSPLVHRFFPPHRCQSLLCRVDHEPQTATPPSIRCLPAVRAVQLFTRYHVC